MSRLAQDAELRAGAGAGARKEVNLNYSLTVLGQRLYEILKIASGEVND
jgi:hypothetical protein